MNQKASSQSASDQVDLFAQRIIAVGVFVGRLALELFDGARRGHLPWHYCFITGIALQIAIGRHWDFAILKLLNCGWLYPTWPPLFRFYYWLSILSPFWLWGLYKTALKQRFLSHLTRVFADIRLKNGRGLPPNYVFDHSIDSLTRKLRLYRNGIQFSDFRDKKPQIEGALQVHIDDIREDRAKGTVDIIYSPHPMPEQFKPDRMDALQSLQFFVGTTRSNQYKDSLYRNPHLLVAGQTGGGKSTFLRQLITSLYLNNKEMRFTLIDLKGGLEFQIFETLPRVHVIATLGESVYELKQAATEIEQRMKLIKENKCTDLRGLHRIPQKDRKVPIDIPLSVRLDHHLIVVDEAAELFLVGPLSPADEIQSARRILSQIARQGRSLGIHLAVATQRPDSRALDPQIKANLTGVLCFQMVNDASSISVLGNGRATDLPPVPGRAIWKNTQEMVEVQTPHLTADEAAELVRPWCSEAKTSQALTPSGNQEGVSVAPGLERNARLTEKADV